VKRKKSLEAREKAFTLRGNGNPASNAQKRHKSEKEKHNYSVVLAVVRIPFSAK